MQRLEVSGVLRLIYGSLGVKRLTFVFCTSIFFVYVMLHGVTSLVLVHRAGSSAKCRIPYVASFCI